ncbi:hypothetical protein ASE86_10775 [Sphingomonas sp. Leaf33]|uniref:hypothetical protein n=1 Tax=Sphingomonas sp. Leaf33 TaxID=1736215 RepID=UPI0006F334D3|nr:hypothetical protein [Sphingomonas sp. Leaf33]KQN26565.1 hypothetical protein ASE86_10775 [Sphingomonas sp. Leaf33]
MSSPGRRFAQFVAIDWSGAVGPRQKGIAVAECTAGDAAPALVRPGHIWSRAEVLDQIRAAGRDTLIGVDLGPALPFVDRGAYFPEWSESPTDARGLWALVEQLCTDDAHFAASSFIDHPEAARHFRRHGGRTGDLFEPGRGRLRETERAQQRMGLSPYSNLNLVGAAQVGKSSLTGMRLLHRLDGQVAVWPFDPVPETGAVLVELYTTLAAIAAGRTPSRSKMRSHAELDAALVALGSRAGGGDGPISDHASDAILTAAWMRIVADRPNFWHPLGLTEQIARTEGWTFGVV